MIIINSKEELFGKIQDLLMQDFRNSLNSNSELSDEEKEANVVLIKKKIKQDSEGVSNLIYMAYGKD